MIARGDIRWLKFASPDRRRPVLVLGRPDTLPSLSQIVVVPMSSSIRGLAWEVVLDVGDGVPGRCTLKVEWIRAVDRAVLGAWMRWGLSAWLNAYAPDFPPGTLVSNLVGGYLVGLAVAYFAARHDLAPEWRLFAVTGFLGGLTTFSTYSSEVTQLLLRGEYAAGSGLALAHVAGSLALTIAGLATFRAFAA